MNEKERDKPGGDAQATVSESMSGRAAPPEDTARGVRERLDLPTVSESQAPKAEPPAPPLARPTSVDPGLPDMSLSDDDDERVSHEQPGRYTVRSVHGRGGQARVLLALDEHIGRDVAIKELLPEGFKDASGSYPQSLRSTPGMVRFLREARVTGQLEHPNIVPVHEVGRRPDGTLYYTMRFVRGATLSKKLQACRTLQERLKLLGPYWDMCNAIAYAHSRGVVHRDIKPENIMVGEFGETVVLDWGIAKVKGHKDIRAHDLEKDLKLFHESGGKTSAGTAIGTPSYMSPEQAHGDIEAIDERSDVWGLGAVLYELLTGSPPYAGTTAMEIILKVGKDPIRPIRELVPDAPPELAAVAEKALQKDAARRYQSAKEFAEEINVFMTGGRVGAYAYSSWELLKRFARQNKPAIIAAGLVLAVILGALVMVSFTLRSESRALESESAARKREETARTQEHQERLVANFHLAQAYAEKADRLVEDQRYLSAAVFAAASLLHNPAHPGSEYFQQGFEETHPGSRELRIQAASTVYRTRFHAVLARTRSFQGKEVLTQPAISPDGTLLAVGSFDRSVRIWDLRTGQLVQTLKGHRDRVYGLAFSPDGRRLASSSRDRSIILWNPTTGKAERTLTGHTDLVYAVDFSPDGTRLASASWDRTARLWDPETGQQLLELKGHSEKINAVAFSPDGGTLATAGLDRTVRLWKLPSGKPAGVFRGHTDDVFDLAFSPNGKRLASGGADRNIILWELPKGTTRLTLRGHQDGVLSLAFSPDGGVLASAGYDRTLRLWETKGGAAILSVEAHQDFIHGLAFSRDGRSLVSASYDRTAALFEVRPSDALVVLKGHQGLVYGLAYSPDGQRLASSGWDRQAVIWDLAKRRPVLRLTGHQNVVDRVAFSADGRWVATSCRDQRARLWDASTGKLLRTFVGHTDMVYGVAFSPQGDRLATSGIDKTVRLWDPSTGEVLKVLTEHRKQVDKVVFSPDGNRLASASNDRTVRLWNAHTGEQLRVFGGHQDWISDVEFSPDGRRLASSGKDGLAIVWDVDSGRQLFALRGHTQWVNSVKFSPDGRFLATASDDATARLWSAQDGSPLLILHLSVGVVALDFARDSRSLAMGDGNDVAIFPLDLSALQADPKKLLQEAEGAAGMKLSGFQLQATP